MNKSTDEKRVKADKVIDMILKYIKDHDLQAGDRLPSERALADTFSVGRSVVREATRVLSAMSIIEIHQQGGMFVADLNERSYLDRFQLIMKSGQISLSEVMEVRLILEVECIALAAKNITDKQLECLKDILCSVSVDDPDAFADADRALHSLIYSATGNRALQLLMQTVSMWAAVSRSFSNTFVEARQLSHADHEAIYAALAARDVEKCRASMKQHILHLNSIENIGSTIVKTELSKMLDSGLASAI